MLNTVNIIIEEIQSIITREKLDYAEMLATLHLLQSSVEVLFDELRMDISNVCDPEEEDLILERYKKLIQ